MRGAQQQLNAGECMVCWLLLFGVLSLAMAAAPMANGPRVALVMARLAAIQQGLRLQGACFHSPSVFHGHAHTASSTNTRSALARSAR